MASIRPVLVGFLACFVCVCVVCLPAYPADFIVDSGVSQSLDTPLHLTTEKYGNEGTLTIQKGVSLALDAGVKNVTPLEGDLSALDLGVVINEGTIDAKQTILFREYSRLDGAVQSSSNVIFDGAVGIYGKITAETIMFNAGSDYSVVDAGAELNTERLTVNGQVAMYRDSTFKIASLELGPDGAILEVGADIIVSDNYVAASGSRLVGQGTITLAGGGGFLTEFGKYGEFNNFLAGTVSADMLTVQGRSYIADYLTVAGDLVFGAGSYTESTDLLSVEEKLFLEKDAILKLGDYAIDQYGCNGVFYGGFKLANGALLTSMMSDGALSFALTDHSEIGAGATLSAKNITLDGFGRNVTNAGRIQADAKLYLHSIELSNTDGGTIEVDTLILTEGSVLDLSDSNAENGGLTFLGDKILYIDDSQLRAVNGKTLTFDGVTIENWNSTNGGGIVATNLHFGEGAMLSGIGAVDAPTVFADGSKLVLGVYNPTNGFTYQNNFYIDFGDKNVTFEKGSTIAMTIGPDGYGWLRTEGSVKVDEGVFLEIVDGSDFSDVTQQFCVAIGNSASEFDLKLGFESLFFKLSDVFRLDEEGWALLMVEVTKQGNLSDFVSPNQREFALMLEQSQAQKQVLDSLLKINSTAELRRVFNSVLGDIRANGLVAAMSQPWQIPMEQAGMQRLSLYVPRRGRTTNLSPTDAGYLGQSASPLSCNLWFDSYYNHTNLRSDGNVSGGLGDRFGFYLGNEWTPTNESLLGWTFGYANGAFTQDNGFLRINDYQFGLYGGANLFKRNFQVRGYVGYGHLDFTHDRYVSLSHVDHNAHGSTPGDSIAASFMLLRPVDLTDRFLFKPTFAVDFERISQKGFREYGSPGIVLSYDSAEFQRLMLRVGASGEYSLPRGSIWGRFFYGIKVAGDTAAQSRTRFVGVTEPGVAVYSVDIGESVFDVGLGGKHTLNAAKTLWIFGDYNGRLTKRSDSHTGSIGFVWQR